VGTVATFYLGNENITEFQRFSLKIKELKAVLQQGIGELKSAADNFRVQIKSHSNESG